MSTDNDSRWVTLTESERAPAYVQRRTHCPDVELTKYQYAFSRNFRQKGMIALNTYLRQYQCVNCDETLQATETDYVLALETSLMFE